MFYFLFERHQCIRHAVWTRMQKISSELLLYVCTYQVCTSVKFKPPESRRTADGKFFIEHLTALVNVPKRARVEARRFVK